MLGVANGNQTLSLDSGGNEYSCLELTEANSNGFRICNDGSGTNRLVFSNYHDGQEWMWIDRDDGTINFLNDTVFTNINVTNVLTDGNVTANYFIGNGSQLTGLKASPWTLDGSDIYYNTGNVGIGTTDPQAGLHVFPDDPTVGVFFVGDDFNFAIGSPGQTIPTAGYFIFSGEDSYFHSKVANNYFNGNVGIGTTVPQYKLDVRGAIAVGTAGATNRIHFVATPTADTDATPKGYVDDLFGWGRWRTRRLLDQDCNG